MSTLKKFERGFVKLAKQFNFNYHSVSAWTTLLFSVLSAIIALLKVFGIEVTPEQTKDVTLAITAILNVLVAFGILTGKQDKQRKDNDK